MIYTPVPLLHLFLKIYLEKKRKSAIIEIGILCNHLHFPNDTNPHAADEVADT